jgi:hypothetical protein
LTVVGCRLTDGGGRVLEKVGLYPVFVFLYGKTSLIHKPGIINRPLTTDNRQLSTNSQDFHSNSQATHTPNLDFSREGSPSLHFPCGKIKKCKFKIESGKMCYFV